MLLRKRAPRTSYRLAGLAKCRLGFALSSRCKMQTLVLRLVPARRGSLRMTMPWGDSCCSHPSRRKHGKDGATAVFGLEVDMAGKLPVASAAGAAATAGYAGDLPKGAGVVGPG